MIRIALLMITIAGSVLMTGCGSDARVSVDPGQSALADLGQMLKMLADEGKKPPAKLTELEPVEPLVPVAGPAIRNGDVVYIWGAGYAAGSVSVVAHEKKTPNEGGWVLLQDGAVKKMTSDEFKSAPIAGKK